MTYGQMFKTHPRYIKSASQAIESFSNLLDYLIQNDFEIVYMPDVNLIMDYFWGKRRDGWLFKAQPKGKGLKPDFTFTPETLNKYLPEFFSSQFFVDLLTKKPVNVLLEDAVVDNPTIETDSTLYQYLKKVEKKKESD
jgi:hypothetical protein